MEYPGPLAVKFWQTCFGAQLRRLDAIVRSGALM